MEIRKEPQQRRLNNLKRAILKSDGGGRGARLHIELSRKNGKKEKVNLKVKRGLSKVQSTKRKKCIH